MNFCLFQSSCLHKENYVASTNHAPHLRCQCGKFYKGPDSVSMYKMVASNLPAVCGPVLWPTVIKLYNAKTKLLSHACMQLPLAHWLQV